MNYLDGSVVIFSIIELGFSGGSGALSALRAVRIFRYVNQLVIIMLGHSECFEWHVC